MNSTKNIILVTIDSLRPDHLSFFGYEKNTSPNINEICKKSIVFKNAYSTAPYTKASFKSIFTGTYPFSYCGYHSIRNLDTLPQILHNHRYKTAGFPNIPLLSKYYGYDKGFNFFVDSANDSGTHPLSKLFKKIKVYNFALKLFKYLPTGIPLGLSRSPYFDAYQITNMVTKWLYNNFKSRFFVWLHYMDVHYPYSLNKHFYRIVNGNDNIPSFILTERINQKIFKNIFYGKTFDKKYLELAINLYDSKIRYVDEHIGALLNFLERKDILDNTILIITADHGEEFLEHGAYGHVGKYFYTHMYQELLKVPLIIYNSNYSPKIINDNVSILDLFSTIIDMLKIDLSNGLIESLSLSTLIEDGRNIRDIIISEASLYNKERGTLEIKYDERRVISVIYNEWKYIYYESPSFSSELYNLKKDPYERNNLIDENEDIIDKFKEIINRHIEYSKKSWKIFKQQKLKRKIKKLKSKNKL